MYDRVNVDSTINMSRADRCVDRAAEAAAPARRQPRHALCLRQPRLHPLAGDAGIVARARATRATTSSGCGGGPRSAATRTRRPRARCSGACRSSSRRSRSSTAAGSTTAATTRCALARSRSLAEVASLIWTGRFDGAFPAAPLPGAARRGGPTTRCRSSRARRRCWPPRRRSDPLAFDLRAGERGAHRLADPPSPDRGRRRGQPRGAPTDRRRRWRSAWGVSARGVDVLRGALILCADHELNVSSFTARCVASAGSHPYAVVIAGLAALEGTRHGGASARVESMLDVAAPGAASAQRGRGTPAPRRVDRRLRASAVPRRRPAGRGAARPAARALREVRRARVRHARSPTRRPRATRETAEHRLRARRRWRASSACRPDRR